MTMTDTELEDRVVATLRAKSAQVLTATREFDPNLVALTPLAARGRRRFPVLIAAVVALVIAIAVAITLVLVDQRESTEPAREPTRPVSQLRIVALPSLSYQAREFTTEPGLNEIEFVSAGTHTLVFADPALSAFQLSSSDNRPARGTVELEAGRDYVIRDVVLPGHAQAGEMAVIHVTDGPARPTKGDYRGIDPPTDLQEAPDFIALHDQKGHVDGYVKVLDYFPARQPFATVFADDLVTVIGRFSLQRGFVPLGEDPEAVPKVTPTTRP
jgi:hypothetical protein